MGRGGEGRGGENKGRRGGRGVEGSGRKGKKESRVHDVVYTSLKNKKTYAT